MQIAGTAISNYRFELLDAVKKIEISTNVEHMNYDM